MVRKFLTRLELLNPSSGDYDRLHKLMEAMTFYRTIVGDDGVHYQLPTGTYFYHGALTGHDVRQLAEGVLAAMGKPGLVIVVDYGEAFWSLAPARPA